MRPFGSATRLLACTALALPLGLAACRSSAGRGSPASARADASPTLEEIFLLPGIQGRPPRAESLSADGEWLLLEWNPLVSGAEGRREISESDALRLLCTSSPEESAWRGLPLADLLPPSATPPPPSPPLASKGGTGTERSSRARHGRLERAGGELTTAWSHRGHRLAVARGERVFVLERSSAGREWAARLLYADPPQTEGLEASEPAESAHSTAAAAPRLGTVHSLAFTEDDRGLCVRGADEEYVFPIAQSEPASWPLALDLASCLTGAIEANPAELQWSRDLRVAFSAKSPVAFVQPEPAPTPASPPAADSGSSASGESAEVAARAADASAVSGAPAPDAGPKADPPSEAPARVAAHVLDTASARAVALEGLAQIRWLEDPELSPDGRYVAARDVDRSSEPPATLVPDFLTARVSTRESRRELADDPAPPVHMRLWDAASGAPLGLDIPAEPGAWVSEIGWAPPSVAPASGVVEPARYAVRVLSPDFRTLELWCWGTGGSKRLHHEQDARWIGGPAGNSRWSGDGRTIVHPSEVAPGSSTPGRCQLFAIDPESGALRQLTEVEGEVSSFVTRRDGGVLFTASDANPARRWIGYIAPEVVRGERPASTERLSAPEGWNTALVAAMEGRRVVFAHEELGLPAELWATEIGSSAPAVRLTDTLPETYRRVDWIRPQAFEALAEDGTRLRSHVYLPRATSLARADRPRACIVFIHGAGYLQNVTDSMTEYEVNLMFHSRLAEQGYVVLDVDYRGSAGYGGRFRTDVQGHLGGKDLGDIHAAVDALAARGVIDRRRVGCYGGSYGGFLTLMALFTAPERWVCGAALRSVTDWRTYSPSYTQPRLGRPSMHAEAYARSSPIDHAAGLADPLLVLHGMVDSNVFAQDSIRLIETLIDLGKDFDVMLYPSQGHGFDDGMHWLDEYRRIERFLRAHLGRP